VTGAETKTTTAQNPKNASIIYLKKRFLAICGEKNTKNTYLKIIIV